MKLILFLLFLSSAVQCQNKPESSVNHEDFAFKQKWNNAILNALQRKHPGYEESPADQCSKDCEMKPPLPMPQFADINSYSDVVAETSAPTYLRHVCRFISVVTDCDDLCPDGQRKQLLRNFLVPLKYYCQESDLINSAACLVDVLFENLSECVQCDQFTSARQSKTTKAGLEQALSSACEYVKCFLKCTDEKRAAKITGQANEEFLTLVGKFGVALESLRYFDLFGDKTIPVPDIPDNCKP